MAWRWESWEEYVEAVHPAVVNKRGRWRHSSQVSAFEAQRYLWQAVRELEESVRSLHDLGFSGNDHEQPSSDPKIINNARSIVLHAIHSGESLLLFDSRLAKDAASYGFLHQNDLLEHWDRYAAGDRIGSEIHQLLRDIAELLDGQRRFAEADSHFIVDQLDLPASLESDFRLARNLFSLGFDDVGLLIAGRGLEGVLREITRLRKIELVDTKNRLSPAYEADFYDLIEIVYHLRWKRTGTRLVNAQTKALLHYLRTLRNAGAHPVPRGSGSVTSPRETAVVVAGTANRLWKEAITRALIAPKKIQKIW
jgi:hypothetical protein